MTQTKLFALLFVSLVSVADANAAGSCSAEARTEGGAYVGCVVRTGDREFRIGAERSSAEGCAQVCAILAEVGASRRANSFRASVQ